jgi:hypothetical protein
VVRDWSSELLEEMEQGSLDQSMEQGAFCKTELPCPMQATWGFVAVVFALSRITLVILSGP